MTFSNVSICRTSVGANGRQNFPIECPSTFFLSAQEKNILDTIYTLERSHGFTKLCKRKRHKKKGYQIVPEAGFFATIKEMLYVV